MGEYFIGAVGISNYFDYISEVYKMSKAIQCDRCKEFFLTHGAKEEIHENWVKIHNRDRNTAGIDKFDLCDMCYGELMTFMEQYKNEQTEN